MMGSMCKNDTDLVTLQIKCDGPIGGLTVTADAKANVKGYVHHPEVMLPPSPAGKLDVGGAVGNGILTVIKDIGMKEPYSGQTSLVSGEIAEDLTYYFASSEQIPTSVALGVLMEKNNTVKQAGGFIIQLMPFASEEVIASLEEKIANFTSITDHLNRGDKPEEIIRELMGDFDVSFQDKIPTSFYCNCSKERISKAIVSIGKEEIQKMIDEGNDIEVNCHFCNSHYNLSVEELKELLAYARS
jgi:molecular chaperone Hsp33